MIHRIYNNLHEYIVKGKVLILYGPRQVGKTTLLKKFYSEQKGKRRFEIGEDKRLHMLFNKSDRKELEQWIGTHKGIIIDEAQDIPNIGIGLKILIDLFPDLSIIVSGSSSFELGQNISEPLVGRKKTIYLYPISIMEMINNGVNHHDITQEFEDMMIYGMYPWIRTQKDFNIRQQELEEFTHSLLLKNILQLERIKGSAVLLKLLTIVALHIGSELSIDGLAQQVGLDKNTVERYLDLLEKGFIIKSLRPYYTNTGKSLRKKSKYYFWDLGIRNALLQQRQPIGLRTDTGALRENFFLMERIKYLHYTKESRLQNFWRSYNGQEIDLFEQKNGTFDLFECKISPKKSSNLPTQWKNEHGATPFHIINPETVLQRIV